MDLCNKTNKLTRQGLWRDGAKKTGRQEKDYLVEENYVEM